MYSHMHWIGQGLQFGTKARVERSKPPLQLQWDSLDDRRPRGDRALAQPPRRRQPQIANLEALEYRTLLSGPPTSIPQHYPNIRIAELSYGDPTDSFSTQLLTNSVDLVVLGGGQHSAYIHSVAPNTPQMIYTNTSSLYLDLLTDWLNYADAHGLSREAAFYHAAQPISFSGNSPSSQPVTWFWRVSRGSSSFTDLTWAAHDTWSSGVAFGAAGESVNVGYPERFREININLISGAANWNAVLEYPTAVDSNGNPTQWSSLSTLSNTTSGLTRTGQITFDPPANWVPASIAGSDRLFYVRFRTTTASGTAPVAQTILGRDYVGATGTTSGTIPVFDATADTNHDGYLNDTEYAHRTPGDDARFVYESRAFAPDYGQMRFATNPSPAFQQWAADYDLRYLNQNPLAAGLFMDNSSGNAPFQAGTVQESVATYTNDYGTMMQAINQAIAPRWILMNTAGGGYNSLLQKNPAYFQEFLIRPLSQNYYGFEDVASWVAGWESATSPAPYGVIDSYPSGGSPTDPRTQIATLAEYYLIADPNRTFLDFYGGYNPSSSWTEHWSPAAAFDVGQPAGTWSVFATGTDPGNAAATYKIYQRTYGNGLVLYKPLSFADWNTQASTGNETATTHQLGGTYRLLQADGSLSAPITSITLRNGEGAILIKASSSTAPVAANDTYTTPQNTTLTVAAPGLLANDSDPSGKPLTAALVAGPANGTLTLNPNGSFSYTPKSGFSGADSFTYRDSDGTLLSNTATVALTVTTPTSTSTTIFGTTATPTNPADPDTSAVEVGVKFTSDVAGTITGIRFFKSSTNTGTHVGNLWSSTGQNLATATFTGETTSGWQQVTFATPVPIQANTVYVASYHTNVGHYADDDGYFSVAHSNGPLHALADGANRPNGVYRYGSGSSFPTTGYLKTNYWVDVVFQPSTGAGAAAPMAGTLTVGTAAPMVNWVTTPGSNGAGAGTTAPTNISTASAVPLTADPKSVPAGLMALAKSRPGPITLQQTRYHSRPPVKSVIPSTTLTPTWRSWLST